MTAIGRDLAQLLGEARRWFEAALLTRLEELGEPSLTSTHLRLFAVLDEQGTTVSELARRMGVTRQSAHQAVRGLVEQGLLQQCPDPSSGRRQLIRRTESGARSHRLAGGVLAALEEELATRIGRGRVDALRAALEEPWGPPPSGPGPGRRGGG
ncbi:MarR family winged helix-turn-helix transcriptional regulator [Streptomyces sp. NPDC059740]|uniref:MarR family winged helix-turn-helix transcriptional regulator n=1 Tax=Streptomyces sp. NPDC059740 TaxID=3346926 RepID=UPI003669753C